MICLYQNILLEGYLNIVIDMRAKTYIDFKEEYLEIKKRNPELSATKICKLLGMSPAQLSKLRQILGLPKKKVSLEEILNEKVLL